MRILLNSSLQNTIAWIHGILVLLRQTKIQNENDIVPNNTYIIVGHLTISFIHELSRLKEKAIYKTCFKNSDMRAELNVLVYQCNLKFKKYLNHVKEMRYINVALWLVNACAYIANQESIIH